MGGVRLRSRPLGLGLYMVVIEKQPRAEWHFELPMSIGLTLAALLVLRRGDVVRQVDGGLRQRSRRPGRCPTTRAQNTELRIVK